MTEDFDLDPVAGEYVLGTLPYDERRAFGRRLMADPQAVAAVAAWRVRLAGLDDLAPEIPPQPELWRRILAAIEPRAANDNRGRGGWRAAAVAAALTAMVTSGLAVTGWQRPVEQPLSAVATLTPGGATPALLVTWHAESGRYDVRPIALPTTPGRARQLWLIADGANPKSLGLVGPGARTIEHAALRPGTDPTTAISDEPAGGSPTGQPTGAVILSGKLVRVPGST